MRKIILLLAISTCLLFPSAAQQTKYVAITFDDGPAGKYTEQVLKMLEERDAKATFFLCGYRVAQYPELTASIAEQGHEIGLHGCSHAYFNTLSPEEISSELTTECFQIGEITGTAPYLFRPPGGLRNHDLPDSSVINEFPIILWSVDPMDWATDNARLVAKRVLARVQPGDVILLHDASQSSADAAKRIVQALQDEGYCFVTVSRLAELYGVALEGGRSYGSFS